MSVLNEGQTQAAFAGLAEPAPGLTTTFASSSNFMAKSIEGICERQGSGMGDQTNMPALGGSGAQPNRLKPRIKTSRLSWYSET